jgi:ketosteroid isomerase-like protein
VTRTSHRFGPRALAWAIVVMLCAVGVARAQEEDGDTETAQEATAAGGEAAQENPIHNELRKLRDEAVDAFKEKDIDRLLACLHPDVIGIFQNAEVCRGHDDIRAFHKRMSEGDNRTVVSQTTDFVVDDLSTLYGDDTAVAHGTMTDHFVLKNGMEFDLVSKWTATMVKENDKWLVASIQASTNMFDNGVMNMTLKWNSVKMGGIGLLVGGVLVVGIALVRRRTREAKA